MEIFAEISQFVIAMLSIINPIGAIPVFLSLTRSNSDADLTRIARSCAIAIFVTLTISLFVGKNVLDLFGISIASFKVGGGILIGTMALNMLRARQK
jgi:multiple antibiotic resistance protein